MTKLNKILIVCGCILLVFALALSIWFLGATYPDFNGRDCFKIPALKDGFVPKGMCRLDSHGLWLVSGYMANGSPSRVYVVSELTGEVLRYFTVKEQGTQITGEFGGIANNGNDIWLVSEGWVYHFLATDLFSVADTKAVQIMDKFDTTINADFCYASGSLLVVGESNCEDANRQPVQRKEETHSAYALVFEVGKGKYGLNTDNLGRFAPVCVYSIPQGVRGMCVYGANDNKVVLSINKGATHGEILQFDANIMGAITVDGQVTVMGATVDVLGLWHAKALKNIKAPAKGEGIDYSTGEIFSLYSSASKKGGFSRTSEKYVLSFTL